MCQFSFAVTLALVVCQLAFFGSDLYGQVTEQQVAVSTADVAVYGGTASGVSAAIQAARMGKTVVLMILGQSAATAACLSIDLGTKVQEVPYAKLRDSLIADKQRLDWPLIAVAQSTPATGKTTP